MAGRLEGKVAVVTGAGSGIGAASAKAFQAGGAKVVAADVSGLQHAVAEELGDDVVGFDADVTRGEDVRAMLQHAVETFGGLDVLFNNAGIDGAVKPFGEYTEEDFDQGWAVNGRGVFLGIRYAIPLMLERGGGSIINTASMASNVAFPGMSAYCGSKGAVVMLTKTAAAEYAGQGIRVNAIKPGAIRTAITDSLPPELIDAVVGATPAGRYGEPDEIAAMAVFLASDESRYVTGSDLMIDGGYTLV